MHILVAEDDLPVAKFLSSGLEGERYDVRLATDGAEVLRLLADGPCDLLVLDLNLPGISGLEVLQRVRSERPRLPVLILTGSARVEDRVSGLDSGADDYLTKPFAFSPET
jgi:two-component system, OmpR family, copper resistance phosphate regulon response regulator CusR